MASMSDRDLEELEEYPPRLSEDAPQSALSTRRSEFPHIPFETRVTSESPFLLGNAGEILLRQRAWPGTWRPNTSPPQTEVQTYETGGTTASRLYCNCDGSTADPASGDVDEYGESEGLGEIETGPSDRQCSEQYFRGAMGS